MNLVNSIYRQAKRKFLQNIDGSSVIALNFLRTHGRLPKRVSPRLFSDKLYAQMQETHRHGNENQTRLSDKFLAREFVRETVGEKFLASLIWSGEMAYSIPFSDLPAVCIAKTNHGSGGNIVLKRPFETMVIIEKLENWKRENFYWQHREAQYRPIKPRILIEEFLDDGYADGPLDFRFWCFKGHPEIIQVDNRLHSINPFYDLTWKKIDLNYRTKFNDIDITPPANLDAMIDIATRLSKPFPFVRVDIYSIRERIIFGEMTFTPVAGRFRWSSQEWDDRLGSKWM